MGVIKHVSIQIAQSQNTVAYNTSEHTFSAQLKKLLIDTSILRSSVDVLVVGLESYDTNLKLYGFLNLKKENWHWSVNGR